jgi:hypothetical protein
MTIGQMFRIERELGELGLEQHLIEFFKSEESNSEATSISTVGGRSGARFL